MTQNLNTISLLILLFVFFTSCVNDPSEDAVFLRVENQTGYNFESIGVHFISGDFSSTFPLKNLKQGEYSQYFEISKDSLRKDGLYSTYVVAFTPNLTLVFQTGVISFDFEPDRLEPFLNGEFTFILDLKSGEYLTQRLIMEDEGNDDSTLVRIKNSSNKDFNNVLVSFPKEDGYETVSFGSLDAGEFSNFHSSKNSYVRAPVKVFTSNDSLKMVPVDYFERNFLSSGKYTFELDSKIGEKDVSRIVKD